ncbi:ABC transporter ATP-binding protein [Marinovum sp. 2_MG-2023]|uniref:ABC transporter ATP-binding protein n=1 Tax=unclassified Marinovum TaxID=2647166 RepID=UPI0026E1CFCE|nr:MULTISPECIES: ABC transporter ATP-binding protein [unclassified Marinovum]MDO6732758.1 ABC transporter ATP-binding protein [Marinovum sp. 2_MG-2023]MDO6782032.1 ABC transporter ATP-binding protein [Marinovum sp. 1_MG-2023]
MSELRIERISKVFSPGISALSDVSFDVEDREFVFLLGPSGAGKTTALRLIAGLDQPSSGQIRIGGAPAAGLSPRERDLAMVYDKHSMYPHLTVFENMAYPLRLRGVADDVMRKKIGDTADILDISALLDRRPRELSGGQQQRVAIGRALVRDANAYLMDEPISALDAKLRAHMRVEFKRLQRELSATILYVSHDQLEAMTMGDRIVVMDKGVVQQIGTPREIFDRPVNLFVATFVGEPSMNTLPCQLRQDGGRWVVQGGQFRVEVSETWINRHNLARHAGKPVVLGIRPHRFALAGSEEAGQPNVETGRIYAVETLGSETVYDVEINDQVLRIWSRDASGQRLRGQIGAPIHFRVDPDGLYLFDRETGLALAHATTDFEKAA